MTSHVTTKYHQSVVLKLEKKIELLSKALKELMRYNPRMVHKGGNENGHYVPQGDALLKILNKCESALKFPNRKPDEYVFHFRPTSRSQEHSKLQSQ